MEILFTGKQIKMVCQYTQHKNSKSADGAARRLLYFTV